MPNDVQDWTVVNQVVPIGGVSKSILGDVGAPSLNPDVGTDTITSGSGLAGGWTAVMASFKAAAGSVIAAVGALGAFLVGSNTSVSPLFGQATTSGNLLLAWVLTNGSAETTTAPGWVKFPSASGGGGLRISIWYRPNCGAAEAAPVFTNASGTVPMMAQLAEFSGAATASPTDQSQVGGNVPVTATLTMPAADVAFGDLVVLNTAWSLASAATATFSETFNNNAAAVHAGDSGAVARSNHASFSYGITVTPGVSQPLGVAEWAYDSVGNSDPAGAGTQASVVLAASPGKRYIAAFLSASAAVTGANSGTTDCQLLDGVSLIHARPVGVIAAAGQTSGIDNGGLALPGTAGNSMTWRFSSALANVFERVTIGAYLR